MPPGRRAPVVLSVATLVVLAAGARGQDALPDLRAVIDETIFPIEVQRDASVPAADVAEGCAGGTTGRTLVRFTLTTVNEGTADVVLGDPGCPPCDREPPPVCAHPLFECSVAEGHGHAHFARYALYEVLARADAPPAAVGRKQGFCIEDTLCPVRTYTCGSQGLAVGCRDAYFSFLGCQYVDVTDLPGGRYLLRATVNFERIIRESRYDNNVDTKPVELCDALRAARMRVARRGTRGGRWTAEGRVEAARAPLFEPDPLADGARLRLALGGVPLLEAAVPGGRRGSGCRPEDGWRRGARGRQWAYANASGFLDAACSVPAGGLRRLVLRRTAAGFRFAARGLLPPDADPAPRGAEATVVMGQETGPCGSSWLPACAARRRPPGAVCTGSPAPAFLDPPPR
jgi:hypothetical protein